MMSISCNLAGMIAVVAPLAMVAASAQAQDPFKVAIGQ